MSQPRRPRVVIVILLVTATWVTTGHAQETQNDGAASDAENKAALRTIQMGDWVGSDWMVLSGLNPGDRVIVDNLLKVRPGAAVTPNAPSAAAPGSAPAASDAKSPAAATSPPPTK